MKKLIYFLCIVTLVVCLVSCGNKAKKHLARKWDCVQVDNLTPLDKHFITPEDSVVAVKMEQALKALSWTFGNDNTYQCSTIGNRVTVQGTYEISGDEKTVTLTPLSKNSVNVYTITSLSDIEMTLTSTATTVPLVLHFSPH
jgi:hypothetical protein